MMPSAAPPSDINDEEWSSAHGHGLYLCIIGQALSIFQYAVLYECGQTAGFQKLSAIFRQKSVLLSP